MTLAVELFFTGLLAAIFGSMVGLGGGFIAVPALRLLFGLSPADAAGTSLALVLANSASGTFTYLLQRRVHVKIGLLFAAGGLPGAVIGAVLVQYFPAPVWDWCLALLLLLVCADMVYNRNKRVAGRRDAVADVTEIKGMSHPAAVTAGFLVGLVSSLFGIGGGVIVVPTLLYFSELPTHAISATSHFVIFLTSPVGLIAHAVQHDIRVADAVPLALGGLCGGPIGARLSLHLRSQQLLIVVAAALSLTALFLIAKHL